MDILSLLFSKLGAIGAGILGVLALWFYGRHQKSKREQAEARAEVAETTLEVKDEIEKRETAVDDMDDDDITEYWDAKLRREQAGDIPPATTGKASTRKPPEG